MYNSPDIAPIIEEILEKAATEAISYEDASKLLKTTKTDYQALICDRGITAEDNTLNRNIVV